MLRDWLIVGADGGIGSALAKRLPDAIRTSRRASDTALSLDLGADPESWQLPERIEVAFLCAAITSIETCRTKPADTRLVNVERTIHLARLLANRGAFVVFLSTNQVFDGSVPFRKTGETTSPLTAYGRQKADVERAISALNGAVVRFTKVFSGPPPLFQTWAESLRNGRPIECFTDMVFAPVPMRAAVDVLIARGERREPGIIHVSGDRDVSYVEAALILAAKLGSNPGLVRGTSIASKGIASDAAPRFTTLEDEGAPAVSDTLDSLFDELCSRPVPRAA